MERSPVKIFTAQDNLQAEMILNELKDSGIPAYKKDLGNAGILNIYAGNSKYGEDIFVADTDIQQALQILEGMGLI